jgi:hypothetical protein
LAIFHRLSPDWTVYWDEAASAVGIQATDITTASATPTIIRRKPAGAADSRRPRRRLGFLWGRGLRFVRITDASF